MPFWHLQIFDHYIPQMKSISERIEEFNIAYINGEHKKEWREHFNFRKVHMPYHFVKSKVIRWYLSTRKVYDQIKDVGVDVFYCLSDLWAETFTRYCSRRKGLPYVVRLRGNPKDVREAMRISWYKKKVLNHLETKCLKDASLIVPISKKLAGVAEEWGIDKRKISEPVPIGVDVKVFKPMEIERPSEFTVGYAGRISPEKGINHLVDIAKRLPDVHFLVAGKRQMSISFPRNVEYLGEISFFKMATFYNKVDLLILPSLTEGFPCVILEAYACEKPVLVAKNVFPEELEVFGSSAEISEFETEIKRLREVNLKPLGKEARKYVKKHYTWERFGQSMIKLFEGIVD
jgi:glycosyltransferase involved in cell wall biosynthesis